MYKKLNRKTQARFYLLNSLARSVIENGFCISRITRIKSCRPYLEKMITKAKEVSTGENGLHYRRLLFRKLKDMVLVNKLIELSAKYKKRNGGYLRIVKYPQRVKGDNALNAKLSLV